jgi:hypothetical protein
LKFIMVAALALASAPALAQQLPEIPFNPPLGLDVSGPDSTFRYERELDDYMTQHRQLEDLRDAMNKELMLRQGY